MNTAIEKDDHGKIQAAAQYAAIVEMVAALKVDYDRLEELRELAETPRYVAGWNMPGYMPDSDPAEFDDAYAALSYVKESALSVLLDEGDDAAGDDWRALHAAVDGWIADDNGEFGQTIGKYHYFVTLDGNMLPADDSEELAELEEAARINGQQCASEEEARQLIKETALEVCVRSDWAAPGGGMEAAEFYILLCTGGPAVRIRGELDQYGRPDRAWMEYQDRGTPWTQFYGASQDTLLAYAGCFYFGD